MDQDQTQDSGSNGGAEQLAETSTDNNNQGQTGDQLPAEGDNQSQDQQAQTGDEGDENLFVTDNEGKKYIPEEAFKARLAKLTAQKHEGAEAKAFLDSIRTDPVVREEFLKSLNLEASRSDPSKGAEEPSSFDKFIAPLPKEHQEFYRGFMQAISPVFESYMEKRFKEQLGPVMSFIGEQRVKSFAQSNPGYAKYEKTVAELISSGRARTLEDAYKIASFDDRLKGASSAGAKAESERRNKQTRAPIGGPSRSSIQVKGKSPDSLKEAIALAAVETGYTQ